MQDVQEQVFRILEKETEVRYNSEWLGKLDYEEMIRLDGGCHVSQMLERDESQSGSRRSSPSAYMSC